MSTTATESTTTATSNPAAASGRPSKAADPNPPQPPSTIPFVAVVVLFLIRLGDRAYRLFAVYDIMQEIDSSKWSTAQVGGIMAVYTLTATIYHAMALWFNGMSNRFFHFALVFSSVVMVAVAGFGHVRAENALGLQFLRFMFMGAVQPGYLAAVGLTCARNSARLSNTIVLSSADAIGETFGVLVFILTDSKTHTGTGFYALAAVIALLSGCTSKVAAAWNESHASKSGFEQSDYAHISYLGWACSGSVAALSVFALNEASSGVTAAFFTLYPILYVPFALFVLYLLSLVGLMRLFWLSMFVLAAIMHGITISDAVVKSEDYTHSIFAVVAIFIVSLAPRLLALAHISVYKSAFSSVYFSWDAWGVALGSVYAWYATRVVYFPVYWIVTVTLLFVYGSYKISPQTHMWWPVAGFQRYVYSSHGPSDTLIHSAGLGASSDIELEAGRRSKRPMASSPTSPMFTIGGGGGGDGTGTDGADDKGYEDESESESDDYGKEREDAALVLPAASAQLP